MNRRSLAWIAGGAVLVVAVVVTVLVTVGSSSPTDVAEEWVQAAGKGDLAAVKQLSCDQLDHALDGGKAEALRAFKDDGFDFEAEQIDGDHAQVLVKNQMTHLPRRFKLVDESGWKVCDPFTIDFTGQDPE
jgi:hypothetical protein